jgi:hypothetical protein
MEMLIELVKMRENSIKWESNMESGNNMWNRTCFHILGKIEI